MIVADDISNINYPESNICGINCLGPSIPRFTMKNYKTKYTMDRIR